MMKNKSFKPQLLPNDEISINEIPYPLLASVKLDGCRLLIKHGELLTRSLKPLPNKQLCEKLEPLRRYSQELNLILDGEIFAPEIPFQFIVSTFMTEDCNAKSAIKKWEVLCQEHSFNRTRESVLNDLKFYSFDVLANNNFSIPFSKRWPYCFTIAEEFTTLMQGVEQKLVINAQEVNDYFEKVLEQGFEGLVLRNPESLYKFGRFSVKEAGAFKLKPWVTVDAQIIGFIQATRVNEDVEKTVTELGYSRTSKKAEDRHLIEKAQAFVVKYEDKEVSVPIAMTDTEKEYIWNHQDEYLGKWIEYKFMSVGMKKDGLPRIPKFIRMREDKD
jgi:DNA ligase-1